jgi:hypothetical protein
MTFKQYWGKAVVSAFALGLITMFITAYIGDVEMGWEIWWEIPLVILLALSVWF